MASPELAEGRSNLDVVMPAEAGIPILSTGKLYDRTGFRWRRREG